MRIHTSRSKHWDVTYRTYSRLKHAGLNTVADVLRLMRTDLPAFLSIRGIGKKSVAEVLFKLRDMGINVDDLIGRLDAK